ncbi:type I restriction endonuclease subunit R [Pseudarthrobacter oxydans]|uniref:type I restriction endonuclease subunit R n=1 Tax=Pseudarthrobacter oxydans TaxID=1671 RepID=UPI0037FDC248
MSAVGQMERKTQDHVLDLFLQLGYEFGGNLEDLENSNVDEAKLRQNLLARGYDNDVIGRAIQQLLTAASLAAGASLYDANRKVYELLRYGVKVKRGVADNYETVWLVDWAHPEANHFRVAEEVSIKGEHNKRPDIVLYVNGIALGVIELKRSKVSVSEGIRQNIGNQKQHFIRPFFTTVQFLFAGNDVEGLRYGAIETPEKYWLEWKEPSNVAEPLDRALNQLCAKDRFLELIHDFIIFDSGVKKTARHNQYFGVKAAQTRIAAREGGIIWHTQGSGKSLTMVWLARWIRENQPDARVLIITDRTELDDQIEKVFNGVNESIYRTASGADLIGQLNKSQPWLLCSLVHKFRGDAGGEDNEKDNGSDEFVAELRSRLPEGFTAKGNLFVFVDEAHRTQTGKLHRAMKSLLPDAMFIGFTGTPLLKADSMTSIETFGSFIHTYKFDQAVRDGVVLDLRYEARNIDQELAGAEKVDKWFEAKTKGMTDLTKATLKKRWGTMQKVVSAEPRAKQIVQDILFDMETMPRLMDGRGNAMLVSDSVYQACKFYEMFVQAGFKGKVAIVTSYVPNPAGISKEDAGDGDNEELRKYDIYRQMLASYFGIPADDAVSRIEEFEKDVKRRFIEQPGQMRLLIVVDKLLTGFDAPSATYLYIDKKMRDHGLFQAICRVNRLDGDDKSYGYVIDYRDLFKSLESAITDYTSGALDGYAKEDIDGLLKDRAEQERNDLDDQLEIMRALCEPVAPPKETLQYQHYFCASEPGNAEQLKANESKRVELYKGVASLVRAYAVLANKMEGAGYSLAEAASIKEEVAHYAAVRDEVKLGAGENVDLKQFEAGMRALLDTYIQADPSESVATFEQGLVGLIVEHGAAAIGMLPSGIRKRPEAIAETIINNVRKTIVDEHATNPKYYDKMSKLLDALIEQRRQGAIEYAEFLAKILEFTSQVGSGTSSATYPDWASTPARRALVDFGWSAGNDTEHVNDVIQNSKEHGWTTSRIKERALRKSLAMAFQELDSDRLDDLIALLKQHDEYR